MKLESGLDFVDEKCSDLPPTEPRKSDFEEISKSYKLQANHESYDVRHFYTFRVILHAANSCVSLYSQKGMELEKHAENALFASIAH